MNRAKILEYFDADNITDPIHIVGCGAIGSTLARQLTRMGCKHIHLYDFDTVSPHNIANQEFMFNDIGDLKTEVVYNMMCEINPDLRKTLVTHPKGLQAPYVLNGHIFLCVDNIDLRRAIVEANQYNPTLKSFHDFRMRLTDAQYYFAEKNNTAITRLLKTMQFTHDEAKDATPKSACGTDLNVVYTVQTIVALGVSNFVKLILNQPTKYMMLLDLQRPTIDVFPMD